MKAVGCLAVIVLALAVVGIFGVGIYNNLVGLGQGVDAQWGQVEAAYQKRADLVPNLVATVQGAADFEKSTLTAVTEARASVGQVKLDPKALTSDPAAMARFEQAQGALSSALSRLLVVAENYPELKANQNFQDLQAQLRSIEDEHQVRAEPLQRAGPGLQHDAPALPGLPHRELHRLRREGLFPGGARIRDRSPGAVRHAPTPASASAPALATK